MIDEKLILKANDGIEFEIMSKNIDDDTWQHICFIFGSHTLKIVSSGSIRELQKMNVLLTNTSLSLNPIENSSSTLTFGVDTFIPLLGQVADVQLIKSEITLAEELEMSKCWLRLTKSIENLLFLEGTVKRQFKGASVPCSIGELEHSFLFFTQLTSGNFQYTEQYCKNMKGRMIEDKDIPLLERSSYEQNTTMSPSIIMAKKGNETYCRIVTILLDPGQGYSSTVSKTSCEEGYYVIACIIPNDAIFKLTGLEKDIDFKPQRHGGTLAYTNKQCQRIVFDLFLSPTLMYNDLRYEIQGKLKYELDSRALETNNDVVGRKPWINLETGDTLMLSLSSCDNYSEFTCNNGACIPLEKRCDSVDDCNYDNADEYTPSCDIIGEIPSTYSKIFCLAERPMLNLSINHAKIQEVDMANNIFFIEISMNVTWRDPRLTFLHLTGIFKQRKLGKKREQIWEPVINIDNGKLDDIIAYKSPSNAIFSYFARSELGGTPGRFIGYEGNLRNTIFIIYNNLNMRFNSYF